MPARPSPLNEVGSLKLATNDRARLERLLRCCARPPFALECLERMADDALIYRFDKPQPDWRTQLRHTPLELTERLALIPPPRIQHHGSGLNSRHRITAFGRGVRTTQCRKVAELRLSLERLQSTLSCLSCSAKADVRGPCCTVHKQTIDEITDLPDDRSRGSLPAFRCPGQKLISSLANEC
jgi:hypothetical protein